MSAIPELQMALAINQCFIQEGLPQCIKIDNGEPLVYTNARDLPTLTVLWWIGLGIKVVYNKLACPAQNGTVERMQGLCANWSEPINCQTIDQLQRAVNEAARIQRRVYRLPKQKHQTRTTLFPGLDINPRRYSPQIFNFKHVQDYLADKVWIRKVKKNGIIGFNNAQIYVGKKFIGQSVTVNYDPIDSQWLIRDFEGKLLANSIKEIFTAEMIVNHIVMQKDEDTTLMAQ